MVVLSEVIVFLKWGKWSVVSLFKGEWLRWNGFLKVFKEFLDYLFDLRCKLIEDVDMIDWCCWIVVGGVIFDEFLVVGVFKICKLDLLIIIY